MEVIEKLNSNHIMQLSKLYQNAWFTQNRTIDDIVVMLDNSYINIALVEKDILIGFCRVISDGVYKAFIFDVIINDKYQNRGYGQRLINTVLNHGSIKDIQHIELYCLEDKISFYNKFGFEKESLNLMRKSYHGAK